jgi:hypothetical protein|tara:strand:- start:154 stop:552 length:399 start_codon:yes stop_codon:yes gene_type:complete
MADAVTSQTLVDNDRIAVMKFTNISDGSGESAVAKVDVSALNSHSRSSTACSRVHVLRIWYMTIGMQVQLFWNATTNVILGEFEGDGVKDFRSFGGIKNNAGSGINGDVLFTTRGHSNLDTYTIVLELQKTY